MSEHCTVGHGAEHIAHSMQWEPVPANIRATEDLASWLCTDGCGLNVDLGNRHFRPKGGYDKERYSLTWHEEPHPHWYLPFLSSGTKLRNGSVCSAERVALICDGKDIAIEDVNFEGALPCAVPADDALSWECRLGPCGLANYRVHSRLFAGMGEPLNDSRNAIIFLGTRTSASLVNVACNSVGCYFWNGANASATGCTFNGGLHGLYIWGPCTVTVTDCNVSDTERACICVRDGAVVAIKVRHGHWWRTLARRWGATLRGRRSQVPVPVLSGGQRR
jgi:hypothetical protein